MGRTKQFNRTEVLEKALPLFWSQGYGDTSLQDLEKVTGVNKSGLYSEFKDKEDLYLSALRHYLSRQESMERLMTEPLGWKNIEAFMKAKLAPCSSGRKGCFAVNTFREVELLPPKAQEMMEESRAALKKLLLQNIAAEKTKMPPPALVEIVSTFFSGLCIEQNLKGSKTSLEKKVEDFIEALKAL